MPRLHGHQYHVASYGSEAPQTTLLLHSSGLSGRQWGAYLEPLTSLGGRVLVPDLCGYGESEGHRGAGPFHFATDLSAMLELVLLDAAPLVLVGHSYGGFLALRMASVLPAERVRAVVVYEPVTWGVLYERDGEGMLDTFRQSGFFDDAHGGTAAWMQAFVDFWNGPGSFEGLGEGGRAQMMKNARKTFEEVRSLCFDWTPVSAYAHLSCPTLVLHGDRSPREEQRVCELLGDQLPRCERQVIEGAGHLGAAQRGRELGPRIAAWLASQLES